MRRPLPPELIVLGDRLETAAARAVSRRRTRRQMVLNSMTSMVVAVPLVATLMVSVTAPGVAPAVPETRTEPSFARGHGDFPPRNFRRVRERPNEAMLVSPTDQRPAMR